MATIGPSDIQRIAQDAVAVVLEFIKANIVADESKATAEEAEAAVWCIAGTIGLLEAYLKVSVPEPYCHSVRAFLDRLSTNVGERIAEVDKKIQLANPEPDGTIVPDQSSTPTP